MNIDWLDNMKTNIEIKNGPQNDLITIIDITSITELIYYHREGLIKIEGIFK